MAVVMAASLLFAPVLAGCGNSPAPPGKEKPIAAMKQHDTRVLVVCRDGQGHYCTKSLHKSASVACGDLTFRLEDYAKICEDHYVAFPGQERELEKYLASVHEEE